MSERGTWAVLATVILIAAVQSEPAQGAEEYLQIRTSCFEARFARTGVRPVELIARFVDAAGRGMSLDVARPSDTDPVRVVGTDFELEERLAQLRYTVERRDEPGGQTLVFRATLEAGVEVVQRYTFAAQSCSIEVFAALQGMRAPPGALGLELAAGSAFSPRPAAGLGGWSERLVGVQVDPSGARDLDDGARVDLLPGRWVGLRSRFWALLGSTVEQTAIVERHGNRVRLLPSGHSPLRVRLYVGPIERSSLGAVDSSLNGVIFSERSAPVRALCLGLSAILARLLALVGHAGLAVMLLSPIVKLLLWPLTRVAERWQQEVDEVRTRLAPGLAEIRARYRGEERSRLALEHHRELGVPLFYGLKSLLALAIQLPVFIAAFHVLDESIELLGASLLWIDDLSLPDRFGSLPFRVPFFGDSLNLLPFVMAAGTILSTELQPGAPRSPELRRQRRIGLHAMAAAFFLLFYTFPSGMVLYWIMNNLSALLLQMLQERVWIGRALLGVQAPEWRPWRG